MSFNIVFDYRFDRRGFFDDPEARAALERAAALWEVAIGDDFDRVPAGVAFTVLNPATGTNTAVTLDRPIDDLLIFVAGSPLVGILGSAGPTGGDAEGDALIARIDDNFRGLGPATDFEPYVGSIRFSDSAAWSFDLAGPVPGRSDFVSTAAHEIGHVLGISTAPVFDALSQGGGFVGPNARAINGGRAIPLTADGHVAEGFRGNTVLLDPVATVGRRTVPGEVDFALLADIGYEIAGFDRQGTPFAITTPGSDSPVFGTLAADRIDGLAGNDVLLGSDGADSLSGGVGDDLVDGQAGRDLLDGGPGDDRLIGGPGIDRFVVAPGSGATTIDDFEIGAETILVDPAFGIPTTPALVELITKPFANVSRLTLPDGSILDVFHASRPGTPLGPQDFAIARPEGPPPIFGTPGADTNLRGTPGDDVIRALEGDDVILATAGQDLIDGGPGSDRIVYATDRPAGIVRDAGGITVAGPEGNQRLTGIERLDFLDGDLRLDLDGPDLGFAYRIYAAVFGRTPDDDGLEFWLGRLASGETRKAAADAFVDSPEFDLRFGADADDAAYVVALYDQALGRPADDAGFAFWLDRFASGARDRADMLVAFTDSAENIAGTEADLENGAFVLADPFDAAL